MIRYVNINFWMVGSTPPEIRGKLLTMSHETTLPLREQVELHWLSALRRSYPNCDPAHLAAEVHEATKCLYRSLSGHSTVWDVHRLVAVLNARPSLNELTRVFLTLRSAFRHSFTEGDVRTTLSLEDQLDHWIEDCTSRCIVAMKRQSHHRWAEMIHRVVQLNTLSYCLAKLNDSLDLISVYNATVELARQLSGADLCILYRRAGDVLLLRAAAGTGSASALVSIDDEGSLDQAVVDQNHQDVPIDLARQQLGLPNMNAIHCVPLQVDNITIGKLAAIFFKDKCFSRQELRLQEIFANRAAQAIYNAELHDQIEGQAAECERRQIACEMHDTLLQTLISLNINLRVLQNVAQQGNWQDVLTLVEKARQLGKLAMQEGRDTVSALREGSDNLVECNLIDALQPEIEAFAERAAIQPEVYADREIYIQTHMSHQLCRLVGEALTNVHRHANASSVQILVAPSADQLLIQIHDDGIGFQLAKVDQETSFGLVGMRERARLISGMVTIDTAPKQGTTITILCPLPRTSANNTHFAEVQADFS